MSGRERYRQLVSLLEVPILNPKYWAKVPEVDADAIVMDLEDSAPQDAKQAVRERVRGALADPGYFGGRKMVVRVNDLATPWGREDLEMLARHGADVLVCYPKVQSQEELVEVIRILGSHGLVPEVWAMVETACGLVELDAIARVDGLAGLHFGYTDYAADLGISPFRQDGAGLAPALAHAAYRIAISAAANGLFSTGGTMVPDYRDLAKVEAFALEWLLAGFTACLALSPAHVPVVNRVFLPSAEEEAAVRATCAAFEAATAAGAANVQHEGRVVTLPEYRRLQGLLSRCR